MNSPTVRNQFTRKRVQINFPDDGRTLQGHKDECDINRIMRKFQQTGVIEHVQKYGPQYGDLSGFDYQQAQFTIAKANSMYEDLPSTVRNEFAGPAEFLDFVFTEGNEERKRELGLLREDYTDAAREPTTPAASKSSSASEKGAESDSPAPTGETEEK